LNFKYRLRNIERKLFIDNIGIEERALLNQNYKFKRHSFNCINDMIKTLKVIELSPNYSDKQIIQFYMNGLLSFESKEMEEIRYKAVKEMERLL